MGLWFDYNNKAPPGWLGRSTIILLVQPRVKSVLMRPNLCFVLKMDFDIVKEGPLSSLLPRLIDAYGVSSSALNERRTIYYIFYTQ